MYCVLSEFCHNKQIHALSIAKNMCWVHSDLDFWPLITKSNLKWILKSKQTFLTAFLHIIMWVIRWLNDPPKHKATNQSCHQQRLERGPLQTFTHIYLKSFSSPSIYYLHHLSFEGHLGGLEAILADIERRGTPWTACQYRRAINSEKIRIFTFITIVKLESAINLTSILNVVASQVPE